MKIHELTTKHEHSRVDHKTWKFTSWPQNMKIHELTTKHENSRVDHKTWTFTSWQQSMNIYYEFTTKQVEEVNHRQASCVCYEKFCNGHEFFYLKFSIGSEKTKQSCSDESKQRSTQDSNR
jgi:general stress protein 26